jgi:hypothetical protein
VIQIVGAFQSCIRLFVDMPKTAKQLREGRLKKLGWDGGRAELLSQEWSKSEIDGFARLLSPRVSYVAWWAMITFTAIAFLMAMLKTGWEVSVGSISTLVLLILIFSLGALLWEAVTARIGGRRRNVGLALRAILLSLRAKPRDSYWRAQTLRLALNFNRAAERAGTTPNFSQEAARSISYWEDLRVPESSVLAARTTVKTSAEMFFLDGRMDADRVRSSALEPSWWRKAPTILSASSAFVAVLASNFENVIDFFDKMTG